MRSKLSAMTARTPSSAGPFAAQSRDEPEPYAFLLVLHGGVEDGHLFAVGQVAGEAALALGDHLVAQSNIGERPAHHHFVIAAARAVGIEVPGLHAVRDQVFSRRAVGLDGARR